MNSVFINILSAIAISGVITALSKIPNQQTKALLYSLPIPITIALIGSNSIATSLSISGLALTVLFLWGCYYFHVKKKKGILLTDLLLALLYVGVGYLLATYLRVSFELAIGLYFTAWLAAMYLFKGKTFSYTTAQPARSRLWVKSSTVFGIAYLLFTLKQYLAAFVVTFPYSGVFAVYENRAGLQPQAALFTRNSIAILAFFAVNHYMGNNYGPIPRYIGSWIAFGLILVLLSKFMKLSVKRLEAL